MASILLPTMTRRDQHATQWVDVRIADEGTLQHEQLKPFVGEAFRRRYGAEIQHFLPHFLDIRDSTHTHRAVVGYRGGHEGAFFLEHYLDSPVEQVLSERLGQPIRREQIVEVGNLANSTPGMACLSILTSTRCLFGMGYRWGVFTGIRRLYNAFHRLGLHPLELTVADPHRLPADEADRWGDYYRDHPKVYVGRLEDGYRRLISARSHCQANLRKEAVS